MIVLKIYEMLQYFLNPNLEIGANSKRCPSDEEFKRKPYLFYDRIRIDFQLSVRFSKIFKPCLSPCTRIFNIILIVIDQVVKIKVFRNTFDILALDSDFNANTNIKKWLIRANIYTLSLWKLTVYLLLSKYISILRVGRLKS